MKGGMYLTGSESDLLDDAYIELYRYANAVIRHLETKEIYKGWDDLERETFFMDKMAIHAKKIKSEIEELDVGEGEVNLFDSSGINMTKSKVNVFDD